MKEDTQALLAQVLEEIPWGEARALEANRQSAIQDELKSEGRAIRPFRTNFKE
jgi:hypothetical protein